MSASWETESGQLRCKWSDVEEGLWCRVKWLDEIAEAPGSYLEPIPDFASHSPFGGPSWFETHWTRRIPR